MTEHVQDRNALAASTEADSVIVHAQRDAAKLTLGYLVLCYTYILISGQAVANLARDAGQLKALESAKGLAFVVISGLIFFEFARRMLSGIARRERDLRQNQLALVNAERAATAGSFAGSIAHDLNNVLAVLRAEADEWVATQPPDTELGGALKRLNHALDDMQDLARRLSLVGRTGLGGDFKRADVAQTLRRAVDFGRKHLRVRSCNIDVEGDAELVMFICERQVTMAVINLLINAADATQNRGHIKFVLTRGVDGCAVLECHDDGPGVPEDQQTRLFQPFATTKPNGTGLGLLSVKAVAQQHRGSVTYDKSPMGGACFRLVFPDQPPPPAIVA